MADPTWILVSIYLAVGFVLLAKGADWLVGGSSDLAHRMGIPHLIVGLTIVAWGTSMPEVVVSSLAAWEGREGVSLGNVLGSNIANIGLVLGAGALVLPSVVSSPLRPREVFWLFVSLGCLYLTCIDLRITRLEGAFLIGIFALHSAHVWLDIRDRPRKRGEVEKERGTRHPVFFVLVGIVAIALGAKACVDGAVGGAELLGVDDRIVGLTVVALGTSLPELAAGLRSAFRGEQEISVGNVVGSNVFNVLPVIGITVLIRPMGQVEGAAEGAGKALQDALSTDFPLVFGFSAGLVLLTWVGGIAWGRTKGLLLLLAYGTYISWLFTS